MNKHAFCFSPFACFVLLLAVVHLFHFLSFLFNVFIFYEIRDIECREARMLPILWTDLTMFPDLKTRYLFFPCVRFVVCYWNFSYQAICFFVLKFDSIMSVFSGFVFVIFLFFILLFTNGAGGSQVCGAHPLGLPRNQATAFPKFDTPHPGSRFRLGLELQWTGVGRLPHKDALESLGEALRSIG